jgi:hypothetical protein
VVLATRGAEAEVGMSVTDIGNAYVEIGREFLRLT